MTRSVGPWMALAAAVPLCLMAGCQKPAVTVTLSDGRQVTLADMEREVTKANEQLSKTSARITIRQWEYIDLMLISNAGWLFEGQDPVSATHTRNLNMYRRTEQQRYFDAVKARQAVFTKELHDIPAIARMYGLPENVPALTPMYGLPNKGSNRPVELIELMQWKESGEVLQASTALQAPSCISLLRRETGTVAKPPLEPMMYGLYDISFIARARRGGGTLEMVREDGLELVKVSFGLEGTTGWFRPDMGYRIHRIEDRDSLDGTKVARVIKASDYRVINGLPYPFKCEDIHFGGPGRSQVVWQRRFETTQAEFGVELQDADFEVEVRQGAALTLLGKEVRKDSLERMGFDGGFVRGGKGSQSASTILATETGRADVNRLFEMVKAAPTKPENGRRCAPR